jgi:hypothetical protein
MTRPRQNRELTAALAIVQGAVTVLVPGLTVGVVRRVIGANFENADALEPRAGYVRQVRALGVGLAAAGIAGLATEVAAADRGRDGASEAEADGG